MANLGENITGHTLDVVIKGDGPARGTVLTVGLHGVVIDLHDDGDPWHVASRDIARWRLGCTCGLTTARPWQCLTADPARDAIAHDTAAQLQAVGL